jgi:Alpha-glucosidases, family 31 of glycosyl hydrolases
MAVFTIDDDALIVHYRHETVRIDPWGRNSLRVRAWEYEAPGPDRGALEQPPGSDPARVEIADDDRAGYVINGEITAEVIFPEAEAGGNSVPLLRFVSTSTGRELLAEQREHVWWPGSRVFLGNRAGSGEIHQEFRAYEGERIFGLGQRTHGFLDHKGLTLDLVQRNAEVSIPFAVSSRGYGFLWNNPAVGTVEFSENRTRWTARQARDIDYWITAGTPAEIMGQYADATGHAPVLPKWASGFWQSKLRYRNQEELLAVVREYGRREIPLSVIVTDFFHWTAMGDYRLDPAEYPDPQAMMEELKHQDVRLMVSIWPTVSPLSENYPRMRDEGLLVGSDQGTEFLATIQDKGMDVAMPVAFYDPTNPATRDFVWETVKRNYYDLGVRVWWLDACEPEINPGNHENLRYWSGPGAEVGGIYPRDNARIFGEGMAAAGASPDDHETVLLCRSAWAGQQKYSAAVWSGDIAPTWESLRAQVRAGLSIAMSGIPWWTTDIGGFHGGDVNNPAYRELMVRWFQFGAFCPLFRLHGYREPRPEVGWSASGGPNEIWSYGPEAYEIIRSVVLMRERLRPYINQQMEVAASDGLPPMRPLFLDFPDDPVAWETEDQMMLGPDVLVAPVLWPGARSRSVYLPRGASWMDARTGAVLSGGTVATVEAPLESVPVFLRDSADVPVYE